MNTQLNFNQFVSGGCDFLLHLKLCIKYHISEQADTLISSMIDKLRREQVTCFVDFQASTVVQRRSSPFCVVTQHISVVVSLCFGTAYWFHFPRAKQSKSNAGNRCKSGYIGDGVGSNWFSGKISEAVMFEHDEKEKRKVVHDSNTDKLLPTYNV